MKNHFVPLLLALSLLGVPFFITPNHLMADATTESNCNFGMAKGDSEQSCEVPIPSGCQVANFPGYEEPWSNISKGGLTDCRFDSTKTDWKTHIVGSCSTCRSENCTARFSVVFNCGLQNYESQEQGK